MVELKRAHIRIEGFVAGQEADDETLAAAAKLDRAAFAPLYERYADPVFRYCLRWSGSREAAEDSTGLIFTKVLSALPNYRTDGSSFRSWLFAIAHNVLVDAERTQRFEHDLDSATTIVDQSPGPEAIALDAEGQSDVRALLAQVAPEQRRVLELRLAGLSTTEVADALGRSPGAIRATQFRAATRLRAILSNAQPGEEARHVR